MDVGQLRERVIIEDVTNTPNDAGGHEQSWSTFATRWASIEPVSSFTKFQAEGLSHKISHKIYFRYDGLENLTQSMRIVFGTRIFHIQSFKTIMEKSRFIEVMAMEGAPA